MAIMIHAKFHFNWLMLTLIFGIWASEPPPPPAWRTTEKAGLYYNYINLIQNHTGQERYAWDHVYSIHAAGNCQNYVSLYFTRFEFYLSQSCLSYSTNQMSFSFVLFLNGVIYSYFISFYNHHRLMSDSVSQVVSKILNNFKQ